MLAKLGHGGINLTTKLVMDAARDANPARRREAFQPCRHVDAVAEDVIAVFDNVAEIYADAKAQALVRGPVSRATICS